MARIALPASDSGMTSGSQTGSLEVGPRDGPSGGQAHPPSLSRASPSALWSVDPPQHLDSRQRRGLARSLLDFESAPGSRPTVPVKARGEMEIPTLAQLEGRARALQEGQARLEADYRRTAAELRQLVQRRRQRRRAQGGAAGPQEPQEEARRPGGAPAAGAPDAKPSRGRRPAASAAAATAAPAGPGPEEPLEPERDEPALVTAPAGARAGQETRAPLPDGRGVELQAPGGARAGDEIEAHDVLEQGEQSGAAPATLARMSTAQFRDAREAARADGIGAALTVAAGAAGKPDGLPAAAEAREGADEASSPSKSALPSRSHDPLRTPTQPRVLAYGTAHPQPRAPPKTRGAAAERVRVRVRAQPRPMGKTRRTSSAPGAPCRRQMPPNRLVSRTRAGSRTRRHKPHRPIGRRSRLESPLTLVSQLLNRRSRQGSPRLRQERRGPRSQWLHCERSRRRARKRLRRWKPHWPQLSKRRVPRGRERRRWVAMQHC